MNNTSVPAQEGSSKGHQLSSSSSTSSRDNGGIKTEAEDDDDQEIDTKKSVVKSAHSSINHNSKATATNGDSKTKMTGMFSWESVFKPTSESGLRSTLGSQVRPTPL